MCRINSQCMGGRATRAFTLVELLVVIGIIAVLLAILLPSLSRARQSANSVACQSNLRQIAMWGLMYADNWRGVLPHNGTTDFVSGVGYFHLSPTVWSDKYINEMLSGRYARNGGTVLHCPEAMAAIGHMRNHNSAACTYGLNYYLGGEWRESTPVTYNGQTRSAGWYYTPSVPKVRDLKSDKFWFADAKVAYYQGWSFDSRLDMILKSGNRYPWPYQPTRPSDAPQFQGHPNQSTNFAFGDGHVESIPYREFLATYFAPPPNLTTGAWRTFTGAPAGYPTDGF